MVHFECRRDGLAQAHPLPTLCLYATFVGKSIPAP